MKWFLWPGERLCDLVGLKDLDDRLGFRLFANIIVWSLLIVLIALAYGIYGS